MSDGWYASRGSEVFGPYTWDRVLEYAHGGLITRDDLVMRSGSDVWVRADEVPGLFSGDSAATRRTGVTWLVITLASVIGLVVLFLAPGLLRASAGTASAASVIAAATAWWTSFDPSSGVTDPRGVWTSTTPGKGLVLDAVSSGAGTVEAGVPLHIETDYVLMIDRVKGSIGYGKARMLNTRAFIGDRSSPIPDTAFETFDIELGEDGAFANASASSAIRMQGTIEGDRMRGTFELPDPTGGIMTMKGTVDLTRLR
jgi:hypothetical protein